MVLRAVFFHEMASSPSSARFSRSVSEADRSILVLRQLSFAVGKTVYEAKGFFPCFLRSDHRMFWSLFCIILYFQRLLYEMSSENLACYFIQMANPIDSWISLFPSFVDTRGFSFSSDYYNPSQTHTF